MDNLILLSICIVFGYLLRSGGVVAEKGVDSINAVIIYVSLPAVALLHVHDLPLGVELFLPAAMAWIVFAVGYVVFRLVGKMWGLDEKTVACLALVAGLGNTSFVGLPMIETFFGPEYLGVGVVCDTAGTFLVLAIPGTILASRVSGHGVRGRKLVRQILLFPPLLSILVGLALQPVPYPQWATGVLTKLSGTLAPLALLSVGMSIRLDEIGPNFRTLCLGLGYKLFAAPVLIILLYMGLLGETGMIARVTAFEAGMGPMITGGIIAISYGLNGTLAAALMGVGIPLSFLTLPVWYWIIASL